jgi:hypothetical protein
MTTVISNWKDLEPFGINCLTGERCGYGLRVLCDLNDYGSILLAMFFGTTPELFTLSLNSAWNSQVNGKPAIWSILLPKSILQDLAAFALLQRNSEVWITPNAVMVPGVEDVTAYEDAWAAWSDETPYVPEIYRNIQRIRGLNVDQPGGVCTHQMSGR